MLIGWAITSGRATRPNLKVGICGEHGGDAESVKFCHQLGMNYVSASPYRVPIARLAAAQAVIERPTSQKGNGGAAKGKIIRKGVAKNQWICRSGIKMPRSRGCRAKREVSFAQPGHRNMRRYRFRAKPRSQIVWSPALPSIALFFCSRTTITRISRIYRSTRGPDRISIIRIPSTRPLLIEHVRALRQGRGNRAAGL